MSTGEPKGRIRHLAAQVRYGPGEPPRWDWPAWARATGALVAVSGGFHPAWEGAVRDHARTRGLPLLSVRVSAREALLGPLWQDGPLAPCPGCAEVRARLVADHPLFDDWEAPGGTARGVAPTLRTVLAAVCGSLAASPLAEGDLVAVGDAGVRRHRIHRSADCPVCGRTPLPARSRDRGSGAQDPAGTRPATGHGQPERPPAPGPWHLAPRPTTEALPLREGTALPLRRAALREQLMDRRFGPVTALYTDGRAPFAITGAALGGARFPGWGRASAQGPAGAVAVLEAYERLAGYPHHVPLVRDASFDDLRREHPSLALEPARLGLPTARQLASPLSRLRPWTPGTRLDWAWAHRLGGAGEPVLVPAEVAFWQYAYPVSEDPREAARERRALRWVARRPEHGGRVPVGRRACFQDSSSGCALGASGEEAVLHSLFELAERDAFLLAWHRRRPLPELRRGELRAADPEIRHLLDLVESRGFAAHLLVTTSDLALPSVWALLVNRDPAAVPATFSAGGCGPDPVAAVRAALWEVAQLATADADWDRAGTEPMLEDPWLMDTLADHHRLYTLPETRDRVCEVLGGPRLSLAEAFPDWPHRIVTEAGGDVTGTLRYVAQLFTDAGLDEIVVVDQTTRDHRDLGLVAARAVVPGLVPMCFGHAQQRLLGLERLTLGLTLPDGRPVTADDLPLDPHPFP
ncbi:YcaO-like family protein [Streptomyces sp. NPDC020096]